MSAGKRRPVICVDTQEVYKSIRSAAKSIGVADMSLREAILEGRKCRGKKYAFFVNEKEGATNEPY